MNRMPDIDSIDIPGLFEWVAGQQDRLVDDLVRLAQLETPSDDVGLLEVGLKYLDDWITERIGKSSKRSLYQSVEYGSTVVLDYSGVGPNRIVCIGHYDTVFDRGTLTSWPVQVDGDRISGPGVFDMKGGLVQLVWALRALIELGIDPPPFRLVLNGDEEIGSPFSRPLLEDACLGAAAVLVFEGSADGAVKTARKGVGLFTVTAEGVESHAGLDPDAGASAIEEIAQVITDLHNGADSQSGTSINVGIVDGGTRANVVAARATAQIDIRVATSAEQARVDRLLAALSPRHSRVRLQVTGGWNRPIMTRSDEVAQMYALACGVADRLGFQLAEASVGGASDGNFVAALGIPLLDGLGAVGRGAHARHENVSIDGMVQRTALAAGIIATFALPSNGVRNDVPVTARRPND